MRGKILFISSVTLLFLTTPHPAYADVSAQLKQAETYQNNRQYEQAEAIYQQIATAFPDTNDALEAQMQLTLIYIATDRQQQADAAFEKLTAGFSKQKGIAEAVWQIGQRYIELKKYDKAYEINQYNVRHFPKDMYTMWSQVEIIYSHLREGDDVGADAAVEKLFTNFNDNPLIAGAVWDTGQYYRDLKKYDQANRLYKHVVENWPKDEHALWAQADLIKSYLAQGNDTAAEAAVDKLLSDFNDNQLVARAIWDTAQNYRGLKKYENANELYQHIVKTWPKKVYEKSNHPGFSR
jgi:tetratricopeptide (TPR) repeat protein